MMKKEFLLLFIFLIPFGIRAQKNESKYFMFDLRTNPGGFVDEVPLPQPSFELSSYIEKSWQEGYLIMKGREKDIKVDHVKIRYDLFNQVLELQLTENDIRICPVSRIFEFGWQDQQFINLSEMQPYISEPKIYQVLVNDDISLLKSWHVYKQDPTYVPQFDVGNREPQIVDEPEYYIFKNKELLKLRRSTRKNLTYFTPVRSEIKSFISKQDLSFKHHQDMVKIVSHYNSLVASHKDN